jgi:hypothetical protein
VWGQARSDALSRWQASHASAALAHELRIRERAWEWLISVGYPSSESGRQHGRPTRRQRHRRTTVVPFLELCRGQERPAWLCLSVERRYAQIKSSSSTVNSVFGFGLCERARNFCIRLLKSASYSAAVFSPGLGTSTALSLAWKYRARVQPIAANRSGRQATLRGDGDRERRLPPSHAWPRMSDSIPAIRAQSSCCQPAAVCRFALGRSS